MVISVYHLESGWERTGRTVSATLDDRNRSALLETYVHLHHIAAKSAEMMEKELLVAFSAYNLVRAVMCLAARRAQLHPRQLSFAFVLNLVDCSWPRLVGTRSRAEHDREFERVLDLAVGYQLPKRPRHRSYPRTTWGHDGRFPHRKAPPLTPHAQSEN